MDETIEIDIERLYHDLQEHFGTAHILADEHEVCTKIMNAVEEPSNEMRAIGHWIPNICQAFWAGSLGDIDTAYETGDYERLVTLAINEGFELADYEVT
jgi:hypothetical protein